MKPLLLNMALILLTLLQDQKPGLKAGKQPGINGPETASLNIFTEHRTDLIKLKPALPLTSFKYKRL